jgi:hypothetical protein
MKCPSCGSEASGAYCAQCGARLQSGRCGGCDRPLRPGARFCSHCGEPVAAVAGRGASNTLWYVAGGAMVALIAVLLFQLFGGERAASPRTTVGAGGTAATGVPGPLEGSIRDQADRLFDRVMRALSRGDADEAMRFMPMALQAYEAAEPLDHDGLFHLGLLQNAAGDHAAARETAGRILAGNPSHILGLATAAEAAEALGDTAAARAHYRRLLEVYDAESARPLPEYQDHAALLPEYRAAAQRGAG